MDSYLSDGDVSAVFSTCAAQTPVHQVCPSAQAVVQYTLEIVLGFVIPYGVIVVSYIRILQRIRRTKFGRRIRSEKLILAIVLTFCIFWLPYHIINMVQVSHAHTHTHTSCFHKSKPRWVRLTRLCPALRSRGLCARRASSKKRKSQRRRSISLSCPNFQHTQ